MTAIHLKAPVKTGRTIAYQYPAFGRGEPTLFWAHNGLVAFEDRRPEEKRVGPACGTMSWQDAQERMTVVFRMMPAQSEDPRGHFRFERGRQGKFLRTMADVINEAKAHGGPFDDMPTYGKPKKLKSSPVVIGDDHLVRLGACDF